MLGQLASAGLLLQGVLSHCCAPQGESLLRQEDCQHCRDCQVRATLGKHKATRPGDRVLVAATGGLSSTSLLHILQQGCNTDTKRLLFEPSIIYVDEGSVFGLSKADREKRIAEVVDILQTFGFPVFVALIENCGNDNISPTRGDETVRIDPNIAEVFGKSFTSLKEGSAKQELLLHLRRRTLVRAARELECSKVFTAEHGTDLAVDLLSGVAGGAGGSLAQRIGFKDQRDGDVTVMRPMRDVSGKEVALYSHLHHLSTVTKGKTWGTGENVLYSLHKLTEDFLVGLQQDFPATIPTIFKTGDKLCAEPNEAEGCLLCQGALDTDDDDHCALQATKFSSLVSERGRDEQLAMNASTALETPLQPSNTNETQCDGEKKADKCCGEGDGSCRSSGSNSGLPSLSDVMEQLCYSCRRILAKVKQVQDLPAFVLKEAEVRRRRREMRNEISDFLL